MWRLEQLVVEQLLRIDLRDELYARDDSDQLNGDGHHPDELDGYDPYYIDRHEHLAQIARWCSCGRFMQTRRPVAASHAAESHRKARGDL